MAPTIAASLRGGKAAILIFESEADYHQHNTEGYWGSPTSTIDWCERNYVVSHYIAEWYNTLSNSIFILMGFLGMCIALRQRYELRIVWLYASILIIGIGSIAFHATLTHVGQQGDETPMIFSLVAWLCNLWNIDPAYEKANPLFCRATWIVGFLFSVCFAVSHFFFTFVRGFQILVLMMSIAGIYLLFKIMRSCTEPTLRYLGYSYAGTLLSAVVCWVSDQQFCTYLHALPSGLPNPQLHAWWHIFAGMNGIVALTFAIGQRQHMLGKSLKICYIAGIVPYVSTKVRAN